MTPPSRADAGEKTVLESHDIRFAFFDVDGTIMQASHQISEQTVRALRSFRSRGGQFGLASGRPYFGAKHIIKMLEICSPCVFFSGALVVQPDTDSVILEESLHPEQAAQVLEFARRENLFVEVYTREDYFIDAPSKYAAIHASYLGAPPKVRSLDKLIQSEPILKLEFISQSKAEENKLRSFGAATPTLTFGFGYGAAHPDILFANITSLKASRQRAFEFALAHLGVTADKVAAFGDAEADMPFLKLSGMGVAMGNAPQSVKDVANFVTKSVEEDGVAFALDKLGPRY